MSEQRIHRRRVLAATGGATALALGGCLGDSDDEEDEPETTDGTDTEETDDDVTVDLSTADAQAVIESYLGAVSRGDRDEQQALLHPSSPVDQVFVGPQVTVRDLSVQEDEPTRMVFAAEVEFEVAQEHHDKTWEIEVRESDEDWRIWQIDTALTGRPPVSPEVIVSEFVDALNDGDVDAIRELFVEENVYYEQIVDGIDAFEGEITIEETTVVEDLETEVRLSVTVLFDGTTREWSVTLQAEDEEWQLATVR